jgi:plastocyanin
MVLTLILVSLAVGSVWQIFPRSVQAGDASFSATIFDNYYQPARINVTTGTIVTWTYSNTGKAQHTVTSEPQTNTTQTGTPLINSGTLNPGQSFSYTFYKHGLYPIQCAFHSFMNELVNVTGTDLQPPSSGTTPPTDYTPYLIAGAIATIVVIISVALFMKRRARNQEAMPGQSSSSTIN